MLVVACVAAGLTVGVLWCAQGFFGVVHRLFAIMSV